MPTQFQLRVLFLFSGLALLAFSLVLAIRRKYAIQLLLCLLSCLITAFGVCIVVKGNLVFLVGEGLYQAFAIRFSFNFGSCKTYGDIILVLIAVVSASLCLHTIIEVLEGTIMTALCFGSLVKMILPKFNFIHFNTAAILITSEK